MVTRPGFGVQKPEASRPILLFGARGNLGSALRRRLSVAGHRVLTIAWKDAAAWFEMPDTEAQELQIRSTVERLGNANIDFLFAGGLTNPAAPRSQLVLSNRDLPQRVITATRDMPGCRYLTFGSILEDAGMSDNGYLASKMALRQWILEQVAPQAKGQIIHLQLHTLYGGVAPSVHMFLGQMLDALRLRRHFAMSAGLQLREYHHVDDVAGAVERLLASSSWPGEAILPLSSGQPVQLAVLARAVFAACGRDADLRIGQLPTGQGENLTEKFTASPAWLLGPSRDSMTGVCDWIGALLREN